MYSHYVPHIIHVSHLHSNSTADLAFRPIHQKQYREQKQSDNNGCSKDK
jgi:hypothetical protein